MRRDPATKDATSLLVELTKRIRWIVMLLIPGPAATLSAVEAIPGPPLFPSKPKSESVTPLERITSIGLPEDAFLRFNMVPNFPAP